MNEEIDHIKIPNVMLQIRKYSRLFGGLWFVVALLLLVFFVTDIVQNPDDEETWFSLVWIFVILIPAYIFRKVPDMFIRRYQQNLAEAINDPNQEVQIKTAAGKHSTHQHIEISQRNESGEQEKFIYEDPLGRVIFDSTQRPLRMIFAGTFLVIGLIIGYLLIFVSDDVGFFEYFFTIGWITFCLISMGFVYEVVLIKHQGMAERKAGWFFITIKRQFNLMDFNKVIVESTFHRQRYDMIRERQHSEDPKFKVNLIGKKELNLRVFSRLTDARHMGEELSAYLKLPLEEKSEIHT